MSLLPARGPVLSAMSANLRYPASDGRPWPARMAAWGQLITSEAPHVIGTQEGELEQLEALISRLPARYVWTGEGREGGNAGEFTAVVFDSQRLDAESVEVSWISADPEAPGSRAPGAAHPRTLTRIDFRDRVAGARLRLLNTHLDHRSEAARPLAVGMLLEAAREGLAAGAEVLVTGDFNVSQEHEVHAALTGPDSPLSDAVVSVRHTPGAPALNLDADTFHRYRGLRRGGTRIDWVLHSAGLRCTGAAVNPAAPGGTLPSDHFPVQALFSWQERAHEEPAQEDQ
ncbi:endonuclease/exonuclease/phosphatase family protein [Brevibacterium album]|uniref:endonuclease/exonuclease/phosphatase family protein n=1 Tax=Brevibacterium album TaxID=417948 RepID=UPI00040FE544|nr:endonuclease/exonuclease/phosphatase family protein [Brevibacterium album]